MHLSESGSPGVCAKYEYPRPLVNTFRCNALRGSIMFAPTQRTLSAAAPFFYFESPAVATHPLRLL
jgi:hypothetical protein